MKSLLSETIHRIETLPFSLSFFSLSFLSLIFFRLTVEGAMNSFSEASFSFLFFEFSHTFLFFLCSFLLLLPIVSFAGRIPINQAVHILLFGFLIILTPPILDTIIFHGSHFWSFYEFDGIRGLIDRYFTFFGSTPDIGITWGVRIEVFLVTVGLGFYAFLKTHSPIHTLKTLLLTYSLLFLLGTAPSYVSIATEGFEKGFFAVQESDVAAQFLTPESLFSRPALELRSTLNAKMSLVYGTFLVFLVGALLFSRFHKLFLALYRNARFPQLIYHGGLLFLGMLLATHFTKGSISLDFFHVLGAIILLIAVECAWLASVVVNDVFDTKIDIKTNPLRPLITNSISRDLYIPIGWLFFGFSLLFAGMIHFSALLLLLSYQSIAFIYSAPPLRLKQFPLLATLLAGSASLLILFIGFLTVSPSHTLSGLPLPIIFFLLIAYTLVLPLKDFKDIEGDRADHVYTIPVLLGIERAKLFLGSILFLLFITSVFVLKIPHVFPIAFLFGSAGFWILFRAGHHHSRITYRNLLAAMIILAATYGFTLVFLLS